jgi:hypothetical protein
MSEIALNMRTGSAISFRTAVIALAVLMLVTLPICWAAGTYYGVNKSVASNFFFSVFDFVYCAVLVLPWLKLKGQEQLTHSQRLEKMCIAWIWLIVIPHITWELPWVVFYHAIMAGKGQLWAYAWWAYMDGGDLRYVTRDVNLLAMESGASVIGIVSAFLLYRRHVTGRFSNGQLMALMALMIADFYPTVMYYTTEFYMGLPDVNGIAGLIIKFIIANVFWLVMPWVVFLWAGRQLIQRSPA